MSALHIYRIEKNNCCYAFHSPSSFHSIIHFCLRFYNIYNLFSHDIRGYCIHSTHRHTRDYCGLIIFYHALKFMSKLCIARFVQWKALQLWLLNFICVESRNLLLLLLFWVHCLKTQTLYMDIILHQKYILIYAHESVCVCVCASLENGYLQCVLLVYARRCCAVLCIYANK